MKERKIDNKRYVEFEHTLRYLCCELKDKTEREDDFLLDDIKQAIIVFSMKDLSGETNEIFLENMKTDFYNAIAKLEKRHTDIRHGIQIIKQFMEDYYF